MSCCCKTVCYFSWFKLLVKVVDDFCNSLFDWNLAVLQGFLVYVSLTSTPFDKKTVAWFYFVSDVLSSKHCPYASQKFFSHNCGKKLNYEFIVSRAIYEEKIFFFIRNFDHRKVETTIIQTKIASAFLTNFVFWPCHIIVSQFFGHCDASSSVYNRIFDSSAQTYEWVSALADLGGGGGFGRTLFSSGIWPPADPKGPLCTILRYTFLADWP